MNHAVRLWAGRRFTTSWMPAEARGPVRAGLGVAVGSGVLVFLTGTQLINGREPIGDGLFSVVSAPVLIAALTGMAVATLVLSRRAVDSRPTRYISGGLLVLVNGVAASNYSQVGTFLTIEEGNLDLLVARLVNLLGMGAGVAMLAWRGGGRGRTLGWVGAAGYLAAAFGMLYGRTDPLWGEAYALGSDRELGLVLRSLARLSVVYTAWLVLEGVHAATDVARAAVRRVPIRWIAGSVAIKLALIVVGFAVLQADGFMEWEAVRRDGTFAWAWAMVGAGAIMLAAVRADAPALKRGDGFAAIALFAVLFFLPLRVWDIRYLVEATLESLLPDGWAPLAGLVFVGAFAAALVCLLQTRKRLRIWHVAVLVASGALTAFLPQTNWIATTGSWINAVSTTLTEVDSNMVDHHPAIQVIVVLTGALVSIGWLLKGSRRMGIAAGLTLICVWSTPRAVSVLVDPLATTSPFPVPELMTLDVCLTVLAIVALLTGVVQRHGGEEAVRRVAIVTAIFGAVVYGRQVAAPIAGWVAETASALPAPPDQIALTLLILTPGLYALLFDSGAVNIRRDYDLALKLIGTAALVLSITVLIVVGPFGVPSDDASQLFRVLTVPGLTAAVALSAFLGVKAEIGTTTRTTPD